MLYVKEYKKSNLNKITPLCEIKIKFKNIFDRGCSIAAY